MDQGFCWGTSWLTNAQLQVCGLLQYHQDQRVDSSGLIVQLLLQHQDSALRVQVEERAAVLVLPAVDGEHQLAVGVSVLGADLQDVLPGRRVLRNPHLQQQNQSVETSLN